MVVTHHVTLRKNSEYVEVRTEVENTVCDHRLRVLLPSGATAESYWADAPFDVIERPIALRADNEKYKELEVETKPQQSWTAVFDETRGLAVVCTGLPESAVRDIPERPIALTLFRSFAQTPFTGGEPGGQIQGHHEFSYWIVPLSGRPEPGTLCRLGQQLAAGLRVVQVEHHDWAKPGLAGAVPGNLPASHSFLEVGTPDVVVSAIHNVDKGKATVIRLYNPHDSAISVPIKLNCPVTMAQLTNLEGHVMEDLTTKGGATRVDLKPKQIVTIRVNPKRP